MNTHVRTAPDDSDDDEGVKHAMHCERAAPVSSKYLIADFHHTPPLNSSSQQRPSGHPRTLSVSMLTLCASVRFYWQFGSYCHKQCAAVVRTTHLFKYRSARPRRGRCTLINSSLIFIRWPFFFYPHTDRPNRTAPAPAALCRAASTATRRHRRTTTPTRTSRSARTRRCRAACPACSTARARIRAAATTIACCTTTTSTTTTSTCTWTRTTPRQRTPIGRSRSVRSASMRTRRECLVSNCDLRCQRFRLSSALS